MGFLFRNIKEFNDLSTCFRNTKKEEFHCFNFSEKMTKKEDQYLNKVMNDMSTTDDF